MKRLDQLYTQRIVKRELVQRQWQGNSLGANEVEIRAGEQARRIMWSLAVVTGVVVVFLLLTSSQSDTRSPWVKYVAFPGIMGVCMFAVWAIYREQLKLCKKFHKDLHDLRECLVNPEGSLLTGSYELPLLGHRTAQAIDMWLHERLVSYIKRELQVKEALRRHAPQSEEWSKTNERLKRYEQAVKRIYQSMMNFGFNKGPLRRYYVETTFVETPKVTSNGVLAGHH